MNRLISSIQNNQKIGRKTLSMFLTAGFPSLDIFQDLFNALHDGGADLIEIGIPFSDPIADGPTIQQSSEIALRNGVSVNKIFEKLSQFRLAQEVPVILMGYANPILAFGINNFLTSCSELGVSGVIVPDLGLEEGAAFRTAAHEYGIATILLVTPTTPADRIRAIDKASNGFIYCVSITGVTGNNQSISDDAVGFLQSARKNIRVNPLLVGFGISSDEDVRRLGPHSDGIIVGSALIKEIQQTTPDNYISSARNCTAYFRKALDSCNPL